AVAATMTSSSNPTFSAILSGGGSSLAIVSLTSAVWKPASSTRTRTTPHFVLATLNDPVPSVVVSGGFPASSVTSTTTAPGSAPPESSTTVPRTMAVCAPARAAMQQNTDATTAARQALILSAPRASTACRRSPCHA